MDRKFYGYALQAGTLYGLAFATFGLIACAAFAEAPGFVGLAGAIAGIPIGILQAAFVLRIEQTRLTLWAAASMANVSRRGIMLDHAGVALAMSEALVGAKRERFLTLDPATELQRLEI